MSDLDLYNEITGLPTALKQEVSDFIASLKSKSKLENKITERKYGYSKGFFKMSDDFDEPLDDFKEYM